MNANLPTIVNLFAGSTNTHLSPAKLTSSKKNDKLSATKFESAECNEAHKITPDNTLENIQNTDGDGLFQGLKPTVTKRTIDGKTQKSGLGHGTIEQKTIPTAVFRTGIIQQWLVQHSQNVEKVKIGKDGFVVPQADKKLIRLLSDLKAVQLPATGPTNKTAEYKSLPVVSIVSKYMHGLKNPKSNTYKNPLNSDLQLNKVENNSSKRASSKTISDITKNTERKGIETLKNESLADDEGKLSADNVKAGVVYKSGISNGQKMPILKVDSSPAKNDNPQLQQEGILNSGKSDSINDRSANKTTFFKQNHPDVNGLSELLGINNKKQKHNLLNNSTIKKLTITEPLISDGQRKENNLTSDTVSRQFFEQSLPSNHNQTQIVSDSVKFTENANTSNGTFSSDFINGIGRQITESIQNSIHRQPGEQQITVRLHPPELGKVCIKFQEQQDQLTGILEVKRTQTRNEIEQALPQIIRNLENSGIQIKRLEVILTDPAEHQFLKEQTMQNDSFNQQSFTTNDNQHNQSDYNTNEGLVSDNRNEDYSEDRVQYKENSINMLV